MATQKQNDTMDAIRNNILQKGYVILSQGTDRIGHDRKQIMLHITYEHRLHPEYCAWWIVGPRGAIRESSPNAIL